MKWGWLFLLFFAGCYHPPKMPCEFDVHVVIDKRVQVGDRCRQADSRDDFNHLPSERPPRGCAGRDLGIVSIDDVEVLGHEMRHQISYHCK